MIETLFHYFPDVSATQKNQFKALGGLYADWNAKINVISRKDIDNLYLHHILHSLAIGRFLPFKAGSRLLDVGTGGGFPGIPLAILFPEAQFFLIDRVGKKITVAHEVATAIGLNNVQLRHGQVEEVTATFDFVVSRAVMPLPDLFRICRKNMASEQQHALPNGIICLKGGDLTEELKPFSHQAITINLSDYFEEPFFETKKLIYLPVTPSSKPSKR